MKLDKKIIEVSNLKKSYGDIEAVKGIDFYVDEGSLFAFLGLASNFPLISGFTLCNFSIFNIIDLLTLIYDVFFNGKGKFKSKK